MVEATIAGLLTAGITRLIQLLPSWIRRDTRTDAEVVASFHHNIMLAAEEEVRDA